jgi:hypothetical protein
MVTITRRTLLAKEIQPNSDDVIACCWLPTGGKLISARIEVLCHAQDSPRAVATLYGTNGFLLPFEDPDTQNTADVVWDRHVPKDVEEAPGAYDLNTGGVSLVPEYEFGEVDLAGIFGSGPVRLSGAKRRRIFTIANRPGMYEGGSVDTYNPHDAFTLNIGPTRQVENPHLVAIGFSSPETADTTTQEWLSPLEDQWTNLQYPIWTLEQAMVELLGQTESGAESPFEDASAFLLDHLEPDAFEDTSGNFAPTTWQVFCKAVFRIEVPGRMSFGTLDTDK